MHLGPITCDLKTESKWFFVVAAAAADATSALGVFFLCRTPNSIAVFFFPFIHSFIYSVLCSIHLAHLPFFHFIVVPATAAVAAVVFICEKRVIAICLFCHYWEFIGII